MKKNYIKKALILNINDEENVTTILAITKDDSFYEICLGTSGVFWDNDTIKEFCNDVDGYSIDYEDGFYFLMSKYDDIGMEETLSIERISKKNKYKYLDSILIGEIKC